MYSCSIVSREWKTNIKTVLTTISLLFIFLVSTNTVWGRISIRAGSVLDLPLVSTDPNSEPLRPGKFEKFTATAFRSNPHPYQLAPGIATDPKFGYIEFSATGDAKLPLFTNPKKDCSSSRDKSSVTRSIRYKWGEPGAYTVTAQIFDENGNWHASVDWHVQVGELTFELLPDLPLNPSTPDAPSVQVEPEPGYSTARVGSDMHFDIQASSDDGIASITFLLYEDGSASSQLIREKDNFLFRRGLFGLSPPSLTATYTWRTLGTHRVAAQIVTEAGGFREVTWQIKVEGRNLPPTPIADTSLVDLGTLVVGGEPGIAYVSEYFSDPEGERLAFDTVTADAATPNLVTLRVLEDSQGYKNRIAIEPERPGRAVFHAIAREREGLLSAQSFTVLVEPQHAHAPTGVDPIPAQTLTMDQTLPALDLSTHFRDPNAKRLTYTADVSNSAIALPQVAGSQLSIWALSIGSTPVTVRATNPEGLYAEQTFDITVTEASVQQPPEEEPSAEETYVPVEDATIVRPPAPDEETYVPVEDAVIVRPTSSPDLIVQSIAADKTTLNPGETFQIEIRIWNQGRATSSATTLRYYLSADETISPEEDTEVGSDRVDALSGRGASANRRRSDISETLIAPDTPGVHYYGVCIDAAEDESNTSNNCSQTIEITVEAPPPDPTIPADPVLLPRPEAPDLVISWQRVDKSTIKQGQGVRLHITLTNRGLRPAPATKIRFYRSTDATISPEEDTELREVPVGGLGPGKSYTTWGLLPSPFAVGVYYYGACLDAVTSEFDTTNNCSDAIEIIVVLQSDPIDGLESRGRIPAQTLKVEESPEPLSASRYFAGKVDTWETRSSKPAVVTVSMEANSDLLKLTPVSRGHSVVTVTAHHGNTTAQQTFDVYVGIDPTRVLRWGTPVPPQPLAVGGSPLVLDVSGNVTGQVETWRAVSSHLGVVVVSLSGSVVTLTPGSEGNAEVTIHASDGISEVQHTFRVFVGAAGEPDLKWVIPVPPQTLVVGRSPVVLDVSGYVAGEVETWAAVSSNETAVTASLSGSVVTLTPGSEGSSEVTISARRGDLEVSGTFTVSVGAADGLEWGVPIPPQTLVVGRSPVVLDVSGHVVGEVETWQASSSNEGVVAASLSGSVVTLTPVSAGSAEVTIRARRGDLEVSGTFSVSVAPDTSPVVSIPDASLRAAIRSALGLSGGDTITQQAMQGLTVLSAGSSGISDLTGLEHATRLTVLDLFDNQVSNINALANLTALTGLGLTQNQVSNITPLANLTALTGLGLGDNLISDITPLANLTALTQLGLTRNQVSNITPLANLTALTQLGLTQNQVSNITPLANLTTLTKLTLSNNGISDITSLQNLTALTQLVLWSNQISNISALANLTALTELMLGYNQISDITPIQNLTALSYVLDLRGNQITDVTPLENLTVLSQLYLEGNPIADLAPLRTLKENNPSVQIDIDINAPLAPSAPVFPAETALFPNYPNPFNPETWIPYQLAPSADVTLTIYDVRGVMVWRLALGHRPAGFYRSRGRAAHWDGRNQIGEKVATGLYFYTLTAGDFNATGKMLIQK